MIKRSGCNLKLLRTTGLDFHQVSTAEGVQQRKVIHRASSPSGSYLYMSIANRIYSVGDTMIIDFNTVGAPSTGHIYYMVMQK